MTFLPFTGRSTIRRLHQTVQRNISRQHQARHESTRHNSDRNTSSYSNPQPTERLQRTIPGPAWAWIEPLTTPFRGYSKMQKRSPLLTQLESTLVIYYCGDLSAQMMQTNVFETASYDPARGLRALTIGLIASIPNYKWFLFLGRHFNYESHLVSIGVKILVNQTFFTPVFNTYFFGMQSLLSGSSWEEARRRVVDTVPVSFVNSWKVWPAVTAFSFTFVQPQNRAIFAGVIAVFWQTYLSWLNTNAEAKEGSVEGKAQEVEETGRVRKMMKGAKT